MSDKSTIEWTDATWNPSRGCSLVSAGCTNCYAMRLAHRFSGPGGAYEGLTKTTSHGPVWTGEIRVVPELLDEPLHWSTPRRIFVNSMSDLFHEAVPDDFIGQVWRRMAWNQQHTFQILTKRPARMLKWLYAHGQDAVFAGERAEYEQALKAHGWPLRNVWLGVSVEDQATADERLPLLLQTPAAVRWISAEPLLGPIYLNWDVWPDLNPNGSGLNWVVAGGESGPAARPAHPDWFRSLRDQCGAAGVPFFFKQWGEWITGEKQDDTFVWPDGIRQAVRLGNGDNQGFWDDAKPCIRVGKKTAGRRLDGRMWDEYPERRKK